MLFGRYAQVMTHQRLKGKRVSLLKAFHKAFGRSFYLAGVWLLVQNAMQVSIKGRPVFTTTSMVLSVFIVCTVHPPAILDSTDLGERRRTSLVGVRIGGRHVCNPGRGLHGRQSVLPSQVCELGAWYH